MIIVESTKNQINKEEVTRGTLIWAKYSTWKEGRSGIVVNVTDEEITILFLSSPRNVHTNVIMRASELEDSRWQVRYSNDGMLTVIAYGFDPEESGE